MIELMVICVIWVAVAMESKKLKQNLSDLEAKTEQLTLEKRDLQNQTEDLRMNMTKLDNQNQDLRMNMTKLQNRNEQLRNYSDKLNKILFQESCYFFYNLNPPWKTWDQSRQFCQSMKSDMVVISSLEEQTFIKNTITYYHDTWHGYWIGLQKVNNIWIWVDGSPDTLGYWNNPESPENFALIIQNATLTQSWYKTINGFRNRFICEIKALIF
uniref:C-type lectin domain-containing protein n=1 Tax=Oryzias latipes TaxID=8090 RepID=A0A3P9JQ00_ORYLA